MALQDRDERVLRHAEGTREAGPPDEPGAGRLACGLTPRQRAVLVLRDVLRWSAGEVADLLETSVPSVNSALQRARATLGASGGARPDRPAAIDRSQRALLARYLEAFEAHDIDMLTSLLREDATG